MNVCDKINKMIRQINKTSIISKYAFSKIFMNYQTNNAQTNFGFLYLFRGITNRDLPKLNTNYEQHNSQTELRNKTSTFTSRSHTCGELDIRNIGENVVLYGWLEFQRMNKFLTLRDAYGVTQIILPENIQNKYAFLDSIPYESILKITGIVTQRPENMINPKQKTGKIEIIMETLEVINEVKGKLPFDIRSFNKAKEHKRLQHRYLDLRFPEMQYNLRLRSEILFKMRKYLIESQSFIEVETPTLFSRTPGGAQEFIVPTQNKGEFYSLVQSPQQFKQMLMAGAIDRYFQFARCYRDEGSRPDRQPEFTQLDVELSYPNKDGIFKLVEELLHESWPNDKQPISLPFPRMSYAEAMNRYGSDKPDVRFGLELSDITSLLSANHCISNNFSNFGCYIIKVPSNYGILPKSIKHKLTQFAEKYSNIKFIQSIITPDWNNSKLVNLIGNDVLANITHEQNLNVNDVVFIAYGNKLQAQKLLGKIRILYKEFLDENKINIPEASKKKWNFLWIIDFPLFTLENDETCSSSDTLTSTHHPFTAPHPDDITKLESEPLNVRSQAYDLVLNGSEIGGGSIRIHDPHLQKRILNEFLKIDHSYLNHLLKALASGCPPHGGIALGIDRLMAVICDTLTIRDVIAFPKSVDGRDPLSGAPVLLNESEKAIYHIRTV